MTEFRAQDGNHVAGPCVDQVQKCARCGGILWDKRGLTGDIAAIVNILVPTGFTEGSTVGRKDKLTLSVRMHDLGYCEDPNMSDLCAVAGCLAPLGKKQILCGPHWLLVPPHLKRPVQNYLDRGTPPTRRNKAFNAVCVAAIDSVNEQLKT